MCKGKLRPCVVKPVRNQNHLECVFVVSDPRDTSASWARKTDVAASELEFRRPHMLRTEEFREEVLWSRTLYTSSRLHLKYTTFGQL